MKLQKQAFSLVEIIVGMMIFLIGVASVYAVIQSTMQVNSYNRDYIIASNLAREQIELVRNIRDTNFKKIQAYNMIDPSGTSYTNVFKNGKYYKIRNDFQATDFSVDIEEKPLFDKNDLAAMSDYQVCLFDKNVYDYCISNLSSDKQKTNLYKYIEISKIKDNSGGDIELSKAFKVDSYVVWRGKTVHEFHLPAIFTDYKIY